VGYAKQEKKEKHAQKHDLDFCKFKKKWKDSPHPKFQKRESHTQKEFVHENHTLAYS
jgi:hypothetical protein